LTGEDHERQMNEGRQKTTSYGPVKVR
jgi:hypothetical protein